MTDPPEMVELGSVTTRLKRVEAEREKLRDRATELVLVALRKQVPPTQVANQSPFSPAHVRNLARKHGIPPAPPGIKPRERRANGTA